MRCKSGRASAGAWLLATAVGIAAPATLHAQTADTRASLLARAQVWTPTEVERMNVLRGPAGAGTFPPGATVRCEFLEKTLGGTSPKFACRLPDGDEIKVKFGEANGEVYGEVAATRLLWALGYGADSMYSVRVLCRGCPNTIGEATGRASERLVDPAVIERKMPGRELASGDQPGWSWLELDLIDEEAGGATRAQRDALKLLAVLIQHTDTKPEQQRLICLDDEDAPLGAPCDRPFMLINDLGVTFGRANLLNSNLIGSVNLHEWAQMPVWKDDGTCVGNLPRSLRGTLKDPVISEDGRKFLAERLMRLSDAQIRALFEAARVTMRSTSSPRRDGEPVAGHAAATVDDWARVFQAKRYEIVGRRCDVLWPEGISTLFGTAPIRWLQNRGSEPLTLVMNGISLFGYTRVYMAIAVALAFLSNFRAGTALLLLLALNGVLTDAAKAIVASPRPDAVDPAVQRLDFASALGGSFRGDAASLSVDSDDGHGFPSGHVAVTTAFFFGLGYFFQWRWVWPLMALWIPAMALARLYLGRQFVGDVLGGLGVGVVSATIAFLALTLARLSNPRRAKEAAVRTLLVASGFTILAVVASVGTYDTGRFLGLAGGVMLLVLHRASGAFTSGHAIDKAPLRHRIGRVACAAAAFAAVWWGTSGALDAAGVLHTPAGALLAGALPAFVLLPAPIYLDGGKRLNANRWRSEFSTPRKSIRA